MYPEHGDSAHQLLKHADEAMYLAKKRRANGERHFAGSNHAAEATEVRDARQS
jgi:GGDEF domain-containing protein